MLDQNSLIAPQGAATLMDVGATPVLIIVLIWLSIMDWRDFRLPDAGTLPLIITGVVLAGWRDQSIPWAALLGAISAFALFAVIGVAYFRARGVEGLGLGDAKLLAAAGAWLGWQPLPGLILIASLAGIVGAIFLKGRGDPRIPFGPAIAAAFLLYWIVFVTRAV